ncbi:Histidinol phosphatase [Labilithrix luteola]|uniref:Histidinol phosphatase n=1 Tax=Labilithrix luteola TaxID=1391654 RepID=A0A0K1QD90_9BACT|nr:hypothetical protein [Labilithrix luteola]AKV03698.1 Histidinol phosphatase [Labilithrix luteola]
MHPKQFRIRTALVSSALIGAIFLPSCSDDSNPNNATLAGDDAGSTIDDASPQEPGRDAGKDAANGGDKDATPGEDDAGRDAEADADAETPAPTGRWTTGDLHAHTFQSDDAQVSLQALLDLAFTKYGLDWMTVSNHLRLEGRDNTGVSYPGGSIPFSKGMANYEAPFIKAQLDAGKYSGKVIFSGFEWDIPTHDHGGIGILGDVPMSATSLKAVNQFEYLFTNRDASLFDPADVAAWNEKDARAYSTHADSVAAIKWLKSHFPTTSYMAINHPSRNTGKYTIAQLREMNDAAPDIVFALEGMVGGQMEPDRGGYTTAYVKANLPNRTYGGVDYMVAKLGGVWDALLGEGRHIWNIADSDFHFQTAQGIYSSGYAPGEYAKNHVFVDGKDIFAVLKGFRSGKAFGTYGDLIDALDFTVKGKTATADMGSELTGKAGDEIEIKIRFRSPDHNNYEYPLGSGNSASVRPNVNHVDLIVGDVTGRAAPGTAAYDVATNSSTKVLARFTKNDWTVDKDGYCVVSYKVKADKSQYFRLRGTNLGTDVAGETVNGEPLPDAKITVTEDQARFDAINARNYNDLWFYSNPVFVTVTP